ncbi:MAG: hypothetical protein ACYC35_28270 [Pirellulales bacterium]
MPNEPHGQLLQRMFLAVSAAAALTAYFIPARPDVNQAIEEPSKKDRRVAQGQNVVIADSERNHGHH